MNHKQRAQRILDDLRKSLTIKLEEYASPLIAHETGDPFKVLIVTILTQSCTDISALRAFRNLEARVGVTPASLAKANVRSVEFAIEIAGLQKQKARAIRKLSERLLSEYGGDLTRILNLSFDEARARLIELPGVGPKTADVALLVHGRKTVSVDTHVNRVSKRLGLVAKKANYAVTRRTLMEAFATDDIVEVPTYFMALGRRICRAQRPLCPICPVERRCTYTRKTKVIGALSP